MLLITTSDKRSWCSDETVQRIFLGEWCFGPDDERPSDVSFLPYHWDDRDKFKRDYVEISAAYESSLTALAEALNAFHGTSYDKRYWRILTGPWLYAFVSILFDRWQMIENAAAALDSPESVLLTDPEDELIPRDLRGLNPDDARWNHFIFACAIRSYGGFCIHELQGESLGVVPDSGTVVPPRGFRESARQLVRRMINSLVWPNEAFLISSYLPRRMSIKLQLRLGQFPKFWRSPPVPQIKSNVDMRKKLRTLMSIDGRSRFLSFLSQMIPRQIPTIYLEGYAPLRSTVENLPWPRRPSVIFTSNSYQFDEVFQFWAADLVTRGVPLVIGQHGGFFGMGEIIAGEDHQVAIADRFLTWGWSDSRKSTYPLGALTIMDKKKLDWDRKGNLLIVTVPIRRVGFKCNSWPMGPRQSNDFLADQLRFAARLPDTVLSAAVLRIHSAAEKKVGTKYVHAWKKAHPNVEIDPSTTPIEARMRSARLLVYTYNSTGYLEAMARNMPTVIFWNPKHWEQRETAKFCLSLLAEAGIYHDDPEAAAHHINTIWDNVEGWWYSDRVQKARRSFCQTYARTPQRPIGDLVRALHFNPKDM